MKPTRSIALLTALIASNASADTVSQNVNFDWSVNDGPDIATLDAFDDMGGTRVLTGINFSVTGTTQLDLTALNYSPVELNPGDWSAEGFANINAFFGEFGSGVEQPVSLISYAGFTGTLGAGSGDPIFGSPGDPVASDTFTGSMFGEYFVDAGDFGTFTGSDVRMRLLAFFDGFTIGGYNISLSADDISANGSLTLNYEYDVVPAPSSIALLGAFGLIGARRRR